ncbi:UvrD-helicase domain-containing protein [Salmonella enterica]|nr:UvrD-helicase domain-containing protein [Salmonella enterica]
MKQAGSSALYVSLSPWLVSSARNLYYADRNEDDEQLVTFLSFREFLESLHIPPGREVTTSEFERWFSRCCRGPPFRNAHAMLEEFRGVLTASVSTASALSPEEYMALGLRQSIFQPEQRATVYTLFERYCARLKEENLYDLNLLSHQYLERVTPAYDFLLIDEVQDMTAVQIHLLLQSLTTPGAFLLSGDANQIVHPNFFSWSALKTLFFEHRGLMSGDYLRVLNTGYRNAPQITRLAGQLLKLKQCRFGAIDRESYWHPESRSVQQGDIILLPDTEAVRRQFNEKTGRSVRHAVIVMHTEQKPVARRIFSTPLVFSVQEAKGLEYENVILFNMVSDEVRMFRDICGDMTPANLQQPGKYSRGKDKRDRSLELYKFYINALYVAMTRATRNVYLLESDPHHPLFSLLELQDRVQEGIREEVSSREVCQLEQKYFRDHGMRNPVSVLRDTDQYGVDHRTPFNLTPLMMAVRAGNPGLAEILLKNGADISLTGSDGLTAWHTVLWMTVCDTRFARQKCAALYPMVCPSAMAVQTDGRLKVIDCHPPTFFLLNLMTALFYSRLGEELSVWNAYTAKSLADGCRCFPPGILPPHRQQQKYISSLLSRHEAGRDAPDSWHLFLRLRHGNYIINPRLHLRSGDKWVAVYDLLGLTELGHDIRKMSYLTQVNWKSVYHINIQQLAARRQENIDIHMTRALEKAQLS